MTETTTKEYRIATNEAVLRALGISHLREIAYAKLTMIPGELPMLTLDMYVEETTPECHLPSLEGFDLDKACSEALERVQSHIGWIASAARVETKNAFQDAWLQFYRRWLDGAATYKECFKLVEEFECGVSN